MTNLNEVKITSVKDIKTWQQQVGADTSKPELQNARNWTDVTEEMQDEIDALRAYAEQLERERDALKQQLSTQPVGAVVDWSTSPLWGLANEWANSKAGPSAVKAGKRLTDWLEQNFSAAPSPEAQGK